MAILDSFGRPDWKFGYRNGEPCPYMMDESQTGVTYICWDDGEKRLIRRITEMNGVTTIEHAYGKWSERASLTYVPVNREIKV